MGHIGFHDYKVTKTVMVNHYKVLQPTDISTLSNSTSSKRDLNNAA